MRALHLPTCIAGVAGFTGAGLLVWALAGPGAQDGQLPVYTAQVEITVPPREIATLTLPGAEKRDVPTGGAAIKLASGAEAQSAPDDLKLPSVSGRKRTIEDLIAEDAWTTREPVIVLPSTATAQPAPLQPSVQRPAPLANDLRPRRAQQAETRQFIAQLEGRGASARAATGRRDIPTAREVTAQVTRELRSAARVATAVRPTSQETAPRTVADAAPRSAAGDWSVQVAAQVAAKASTDITPVAPSAARTVQAEQVQKVQPPRLRGQQFGPLPAAREITRTQIAAAGARGTTLRPERYAPQMGLGFRRATPAEVVGADAAVNGQQRPALAAARVPSRKLARARRLFAVHARTAVGALPAYENPQRTITARESYDPRSRASQPSRPSLTQRARSAPATRAAEPQSVSRAARVNRMRTRPARTRARQRPSSNWRKNVFSQNR